MNTDETRIETNAKTQRNEGARERDYRRDRMMQDFPDALPNPVYPVNPV
jgi:hypothetical protein